MVAGPDAARRGRRGLADRLTGSYVHDPHLIKVGLAELLILLAAAALVAPAAARAQTATSASPLYPQPG
jgi:hypothetical protein